MDAIPRACGSVHSAPHWAAPFTFGSLLVAIQVAGGQLTPRVIATTLLRDNVVRYTVGLFVFSLMFAVMDHVEIDSVPGQTVVRLTKRLAA